MLVAKPIRALAQVLIILVILFVGLIAGWLAGKVVRGTGFGIIGDIIVGIALSPHAGFQFEMS